MSLFSTDGFDAALGAPPGVTFVEQWESHVAKVGEKVFAVLRPDERLVVKVSEESFEILTAMESIGQAPYFARGKWVSIEKSSPLGESEVLHYLRRSHDLVADGLTKKLRSELGIVPLS